MDANQNRNWRRGAAAMVRELKNARASVLFGFCSATLEEQHAAFALARALGAGVSVSRALVPTLTFSAIGAQKLFLLAGGEPTEPLPLGADVLRDDRLLTGEAWRNLRILQRSRRTADADAYAALYAKIVSSGGAAALLFTAGGDESLYGEIAAFRAECELTRGLDYVQLPGKANFLGAYETALEEAGGASAAFAGGFAAADGAYALEEQLRAGALGAALLIGESARGEEADVLTAGVPLYAVGAITPEGAKRRVLTAPPGAGGGTILREDGMPVSPEKRESGGLPTLLDVLEWMIGEARA